MKGRYTSLAQQAYKALKGGNTTAGEKAVQRKTKKRRVRIVQNRLAGLARKG